MSDKKPANRYGYLSRKPDEGLYFRTTDKNGDIVIIAAERIGKDAQLAFYQRDEWIGGSYPMSYKEAKRLAKSQFETCEKGSG